MADIETITHIRTTDGVEHPLDAQYLNGHPASYFQQKNLVSSVDENSTDDQYPSAKCIYDIVGDIKSLLNKK